MQLKRPMRQKKKVWLMRQKSAVLKKNKVKKYFFSFVKGNFCFVWENTLAGCFAAKTKGKGKGGLGFCPKRVAKQPLPLTQLQGQLFFLKKKFAHKKAALLPKGNKNRMELTWYCHNIWNCMILKRLKKVKNSHLKCKVREMKVLIYVMFF